MKKFFHSSRANLPTWQRIAIHSPAAHIAWFACFLVISSLAMNAGVGLLNLDSAPRELRAAIGIVQRVVPPLLAYLACAAWLERGTPRVPRTPGATPRRLLVSLLAGGFLAIFVFVLVAMLQGIRIEGTRAGVQWAELVLLYGVAAAVGEEIVARGVFFRHLQEGLGTAGALAVSVLVFAIVHRTNPDATAWSMAAFSIEHGLLLPVVYRATGNSLPITICAHAGWGVVQSAFLGEHGWIAYRPVASAWLSGGGFGVEASVVASLACLAISIQLLRQVPGGYEARPRGAATA